MTKTDLPANVRLDKNVRPQDDFYAYACNHWLEDNPRPSTKQVWGLFDALHDKVEKQLEEILEEWAAPNAGLSSAEKQAITYYRTLICKDEYKENSLGTLRQSKAAAEAADTPFLLAEFLKLDVSAFFSLGVAIDFKDNNRFCLIVGPSELDLPDRDYYLSDKQEIKGFRQKYLDFLQVYDRKLAEMGLASGLRPADILEIETALAELNWPRSEARDRIKTYNPYAWPKFKSAFPLEWETYFKFAGIDVEERVVVSQPSYLGGVLHYLKGLAPQKLRGYLTHKLMLKYGGLLDEGMASILFDFFHKDLQGVQEMRSLKERATENANGIFCDVIGQAYVKRYFPSPHKRRIEELSDGICQAFGKRLANNSWMSAASRRYAQEKLEKIIVNVGYSGVWADYGQLGLSENNPVANAIKSHAMRRRAGLNLLRHKPNRRRLGSLDERAQRVNAWTSLSLLNTNYPAAILQPPFYDNEASWAYTLGSLGSIISHELTHNFDDQGSRHDQDGNLNPWLSEQEQRAFKAASAKLIDKANEHCPVPGINMKGEQVIGELIADLGGLEIIMDVVRARCREKTTRLAATRTVFISYAFRFARHVSTEERIRRAKISVHPDDVFRVNGILPHCDDFYEAFGVRKGDQLYLPPAERARIW